MDYIQPLVFSQYKRLVLSCLALSLLSPNQISVYIIIPLANKYLDSVCWKNNRDVRLSGYMGHACTCGSRQDVGILWWCQLGNPYESTNQLRRYKTLLGASTPHQSASSLFLLNSAPQISADFTMDRRWHLLMQFTPSILTIDFKESKVPRRGGANNTQNKKLVKVGQS